MVIMSDGKHEIKIPKDAQKVFANQGFHNVKPLNDTVASEEVLEETSSIDNADEKKYNEIVEKSISQWNKEETKFIAGYLGADISGTKNANEAKAVIKELLEKHE